MMSKPIQSVLLIEDNPGDARLLREMLNEEGSHNIKLAHVESMSAAETHLAEHEVDMVLLDLGLPDVRGLEAVRRAHAASPRVPLVVLTGLDDEALAAQALQEGAQDYLIKDQIETRGLLRAMRYAIERNIMEEALFAEKERAQVTLASIGDAVVSMDTASNITFLNAAAERMTGWSQHEAVGRSMADVCRILDASSRDLSLIRTEATADEQVRLPLNFILVRRGGMIIPIEPCVSAIHDREGKVTGTVIVFRDMSAARATALQINHTAEHDFLTGLPNRWLLTDRLSQVIALAKRNNERVAVLFLDLDGFKHINDSLGHTAGDRLLQSIAKRLVKCVRGSDTVSRQGGDEFVVLLSEMQQGNDAAITAQRILEAVAESHCLDDRKLHVTTSIGISVYPDDGLDADTLIKNADTAMYQAKEAGRHSYRFFKPTMNVRAVERQFIEESLRGALEREEFTLHYQPKLDLRTGEIAGAEALIRWEHPTRGNVSPDQFIPTAEDCGLIIPIGAWVLREACRQAQAWVDAGMPAITMAVNISAIEFRDEKFIARLMAVLEETRLDPRLLELELTESILMNRAESSARVLHAVREIGVTVALDDFGTGYSSLSYLLRFPVDALKIDKSFVRFLSTAGDAIPLVTAVIAMAQSLKLRVIAEGVETFEELEFLRNHQCDEAQGFYFSRPVPALQFAKLLRTGIREAAPGSRKLRAVT